MQISTDHPSALGSLAPERMVVLGGVLLGALLILAAPPVAAQPTFTVDDAGDDPDWDPGNGVCRICLEENSDGECINFGGCTLRAAIMEVNNTTGGGTITFTVDAITPETTLPSVDRSATIDGSLDGESRVLIDGSQLGGQGVLFHSSGNTLRNIEIADHPGPGAWFWGQSGGIENNTVENVHIHDNGRSGQSPGLRFENSTNNKIVDSRIERNGFDSEDPSSSFGGGIEFENSSDNTIQGCHVLHNTGDGIQISDPFGGGGPSSNFTIGGPTSTPGTPPGNVLSGNARGVNFVDIEGTGQTVIQGNLIGPDSSGTAPLLNAFDDAAQGEGIGIDASLSVEETILIGGSAAGTRNVVSGNGSAGISTQRAAQIRGNYVGTDITGTNALPNEDGIRFSEKNVVVVDNVISGNEDDGVVFGFGDPANSVVRDNVIGLGKDGVTPIGNGRAGIGIFFGGAVDNNITGNTIAGNGFTGIWIFGSDNTGGPKRQVITNNYIGTTSNELERPNSGPGILIEGPSEDVQIGGEADGEGNTIMHNEGDGVLVAGGSGHRIQRNQISENDDLGINLDEDGDPDTPDVVTLNDTGDADDGPNGLQNRPAVSFIEVKDGQTHVSGVLKSAPGQTHRLEFFEVSEIDSTGSGEGETFLEATKVTTDGDGRASFLVTLSGAHRRVTATATDPNGNTSEFSKQPLIVNASGDRADAAPTDPACDTGQSVDGEPECTLRAALQEANRIAGSDYVAFDIPGVPPHFVQPGSPLPTITEPVVIDGTSQPGASGEEPPIRMSGTDAGPTSGIDVQSENTTVQGLLLRQFEEHGLVSSTARVDLAAVQIFDNGKNGIGALSGGLSLSDEVVRPANRRSSLERTDLRIENNRDSGIEATGDVQISGPIQVTQNGADRTVDECKTLTLAGIATTGDLVTESIDASNNCGDGLRAQGMGPLRILGNARIVGNTGVGVLARRGLLVEGETHDFSENGSDGILAPNKEPVEIRGSAQINDNGQRQASIDCRNPSTDRAGLFTGGPLTTDDVEANSNCGAGIFSDAGNPLTILIRGNATVRTNDGKGIVAQGNDIEVRGNQHQITGNGWEGILTSNGSVRLSGDATVSDNGTYIQADRPANCSSDQHAGVAAQKNIEAVNLTANENCGSGVSTFRAVTISGTAQVDANTFHGVAGKSVQIGTGTVCRNEGYGIAVRGGSLDLGTVQVCANGLGGILGVESSSKAISKARTQVSSSASRVTGAAITGNDGDGIRLERTQPFVIAQSNLENNAGAGVNNAASSDTVEAGGNWWGDPAGPDAGDGVEGAVDVADWRADPVGLVAFVAPDTVFVPEGTTDTVFTALRNWQNPTETVDVTLSDDRDWVQGDRSRTVTLDADRGARLNIPLSVSGSAKITATSRVRVAAASQADSAIAAEDSFLVAAYQPELATISVRPDTVRLLPGATQTFAARGLDQFDNPFGIVPVWSATGGTIDSTGHYTAGEDLGTFSVTATDTTGSIMGTAAVEISDEPIPVELTAFEGVVDGGAVHLTWQTASETNNAGFEIQERAKGERGEWEMLAFVEGAGTTSEPQSYEHRVTRLSRGRHLFRLKQIDLDGSATLSEAIEVALGVPGRFALQAAYPNPAGDAATIPFDVARRADVQLAIYDVLGRRVATLVDGERQAGRHTAGVKTQRLAGGVYFYRIQMGDFRATKKLVVVR